MLSVPATIYAHPKIPAQLPTPDITWRAVEGPPELGNPETRKRHRNVLNETLSVFGASSDRIFCDLGLDRTLASRGPEIDASPHTVFVCHRVSVLDRLPVRVVRRLRRNRSKNRRVLGQLGRSGARFVVHTDAVAGRLADFVDAAQVVRLGWPVQSRDAPNLIESWTPSVTDITVLFAGSLRSEKGFLPFLNAVQGLPGFDRLVVPGRVPEQLRDQLSATEPRIEFWDRWLSEAEYQQTFAQASLVALPYVTQYGERGTMSSVLLEAMAYGRPLLVSAAIAHLLPPNYTGAVVTDVSSPANIADGLRRALDQLPALEQAAMTEGRRFIADHHTYEGYLRGLLSAGSTNPRSSL